MYKQLVACNMILGGVKTNFYVLFLKEAIIFIETLNFWQME